MQLILPTLNNMFLIWNVEQSRSRYDIYNSVPFQITNYKKKISCDEKRRKYQKIKNLTINTLTNTQILFRRQENQTLIGSKQMDKLQSRVFEEHISLEKKNESKFLSNVAPTLVTPSYMELGIANITISMAGLCGCQKKFGQAITAEMFNQLTVSIH